jgi:hypothetical protein
MTDRLCHIPECQRPARVTLCREHSRMVPDDIREAARVASHIARGNARDRLVVAVHAVAVAYVALATEELTAAETEAVLEDTLRRLQGQREWTDAETNTLQPARWCLRDYIRQRRGKL